MKDLLLKSGLLFFILGSLVLKADLLSPAELPIYQIYNNFDYKKRLSYKPKSQAYVYTNRAFKKYNYRYKIVAIDTRYWTKNKKDILKKRAIISKFGRALG